MTRFDMSKIYEIKARNLLMCLPCCKVHARKYL